jgi:hypothetical protein
LTSSGAYVAFKDTLPLQSAFAALKAKVESLGYTIHSGWALMLPVGYDAGPHFDPQNALVCHLHDHPSALVVGDNRLETKGGRMIYIPQGRSHYVEAIEHSPRYSVVWAV